MAASSIAGASRRIPAAVVELRTRRAAPRPAPAGPASAAPAARTCFVPDEVRQAALELEAAAGRLGRTLSRHFSTPAALAEAEAELQRIEARARAARKAIRKGR